MTKVKSVESLRKSLQEIQELRKLQRWLLTDPMMKIDSDHAKDFDRTRFSLGIFSNLAPEADYHAANSRGLASTASTLESLNGEINDYWDDDDCSHNVLDSKVKVLKNSNAVFIIHGHDGLTRESVASFPEKLDVTPISLHELSNQGRTIVETFGGHADVVFSVGLLASDNMGAPSENWENLKSRVPQNVIFVPGRVVGRAVWKRVFVLVKVDVESPSNFDGVVYTKMDDNGGRRMDHVRRFKESEFNIDANWAFFS